METIRKLTLWLLQNKSSKLTEFVGVDDDQLNPAMKEEIDREVEDFPRRLPKIMREMRGLFQYFCTTVVR